MLYLDKGEAEKADFLGKVDERKSLEWETPKTQLASIASQFQLKQIWQSKPYLQKDKLPSIKIMKVIVSFTFLANLWSFAFAENYMWGELQFGSNINEICSEADIEKLDTAIPKAVECVGNMMANIEFTLDTPPEVGERRLISCTAV